MSYEKNEVMLSGPRFNVSPEEISKMKRKLRDERMEQMTDLLDHNHIPHQGGNVHIREGDSEEVIKQVIADLNVDVVVMGSVGRSGIPGLLIGNKAEKILYNINCTVLTIKPDGFVSPVTLS